MKKQYCIKLHSKTLMLGAICVFISSASIANSVPDRYKVIISRSPFGAVSAATETTNSTTALTPEQIKLQEELAKEAEELGKNIKLTAITSYRGVPAAGIVELNSKRTYYLTKGQSILGYTLTDIGDTSILLETTNAIANIAMSYAPGQPSEITIHPTSGRLSVLNIFEDSVVATNSVVVKQQNKVEDTKENSVIDGLELSDEVREAVTIKDADGTERISFRELHRLRMEERKRKLEEERLAREAKERAEQDAREEEARRQAELDSIIEAEEKLVEAEEIAAVQAVIDALEMDDDASLEDIPPIEFPEDTESIILEDSSDISF